MISFSQVKKRPKERGIDVMEIKKNQNKKIFGKDNDCEDNHSGWKKTDTQRTVFFSLRATKTEGGLWEKTKIIFRIHKTIRSRIIYIELATIRRTKLVKTMYVVKTRKISSLKATSITVSETKNLKK